MNKLYSEILAEMWTNTTFTTPDFIADVACEFANWNDSTSYTEAAQLLELRDFGYKELFKYFIENIYKKEQP